jgi:hypothetical protein
MTHLLRLASTRGEMDASACGLDIEDLKARKEGWMASARPKAQKPPRGGRLCIQGFRLWRTLLHSPEVGRGLLAAAPVSLNVVGDLLTLGETAHP